jgi:hypothetical protein
MNRKILEEIGKEFYEIQKKCRGYPVALGFAVDRAKKPVKKEELREYVWGYQADLISEEEIPFPIFEIGIDIPEKRLRWGDTLLLPGHGIEGRTFRSDDAFLFAKKFGKVGWYSMKKDEKEGYILEFKDYMRELKKLAEELKSDEYIYKKIKCWIEELEK